MSANCLWTADLALPSLMLRLSGWVGQLSQNQKNIYMYIYIGMLSGLLQQIPKSNKCHTKRQTWKGRIENGKLPFDWREQDHTTSPASVMWKPVKAWGRHRKTTGQAENKKGDFDFLPNQKEHPYLCYYKGLFLPNKWVTKSPSPLQMLICHRQECTVVVTLLFSQHG